MPKNKTDVYTVSRLNGEVRQLLEGQLSRVWLNAEISNFSAPNSGHWYLTLKDTRSQIRCAMFKGRNQQITFRPANGQQVLVRGNISVYEPRGDYQLLIDSMQPAGDGLLAQQYEALKLKLSSEGLFATHTKRDLPQQIQRIGVITSPTGAAIRDILHVLTRRDPSIEVIIYPAQVQGASAARGLGQAIATANARNEVDVLLLTRGGGSLEDLWCFNDEKLAHCIYNSAIPMISAVGHEIDTTISDYVADLRAPTPSAAAELLSKDTVNKQQKLLAQRSRLKQSWQHFLLQKKAHADRLNHQLYRQDPKRRLQTFQQGFDEVQLKLTNAIERYFNKLNLKQQALLHRLNNQSPSRTLTLNANQLSHLKKRLFDAMSTLMGHKEQQHKHLTQQLDTISPLATLSRGYSITFDSQDQVIRNSNELNPEDTITTRLRHGQVQSRVINTIPEK
ncbi:exodeoxyribonuclease VII large subunit [uncultured Shewanella sp.]|uniref:exodeoxyribonuclease VII large subunit n=1 Tax=uncultured Shewanella sp. TaxID=173975 RepID=UPI00262B3BED|nr:exodeoxyribonuclease VII large subunit [uncultured Shewanella sp.]